MTGSPVITFKWFKDAMEISSGPKYSISVTDVEATLEILNCSVEDSGEYVCVASSEAGSERCSSTVTVKGWFRLYSSMPSYLGFYFVNLGCVHQSITCC